MFNKFNKHKKFAKIKFYLFIHLRFVFFQLSFEGFETEEYQDLVTILDGGPAENSSVVMGIFSGKEVPDAMTSSTNVMIVKFASDAQVQARGFQANWRTSNILFLKKKYKE